MPSKSLDHRSTDRALGTASWKKIRSYWRKNPQPCWRCGRGIEYDMRFPHPLSLAVGHIIGRAEGRRAGYSEEYLNSLQNTRPEHLECSNRSGRQYSAQVLIAQSPAMRPLEQFKDYGADRW
jgi:hypothetical protein